MKILFVNRMVAVERGGGETFDMAMARELKKRGHGVHMLCGVPWFGGIRTDMGNLPYTALRTPYLGWLPWEKMKGGWRLRVADFRFFEQSAARWIRRHADEFDIIQICEMPRLVYLLKKMNIKTPVCMRLTAPHLYDPWGGTKQADAVIASGTTLNALRDELGITIHNIPNGVDVNLFKPVHEKIGKEQRAKGESFFVPIETIADYEGYSLRYESRGLRAKDGCACEESTKLATKLATKLCRIGNLQPATCNLQPSDTPKQVRGSSSHHSSPITHHPNLIYVGRFQDVKNHAMLIRAMPRVIKEAPGVRLKLAGSGPLRGAMEQMASELKCREHIDFLGEVPHEQLPELYRDSAVAVLPSKYESFSFTTLEAMACGLPVITTDTEWVPGLLGRNMKDERGSMKVEENLISLPSGLRSKCNEDPDKSGSQSSSFTRLPGGAVVPLDDDAAMAEAIVYLLKHPEVQEAMGRRNREEVETKYRWDASAEKLEKLYRRMVRGGDIKRLSY